MLRGLQMKTNNSLTLAATVLAGLLTWATPASAAVQVIFFDGASDCSGVFGQGFDNCAFNDSPIIIKFESLVDVEVNSLFPTIDGSEFAFFPDDPDFASGTWVYTPNDPEDPLIRYWVAKAGNGFNLFWEGTPAPDSASVQFSNIWFTPGEKELSHLSFYDTRGQRVPGPSSLVLVGLALTVLAFAHRRRTA